MIDNKTQAILTILRARGPLTLDDLQPPLEKAIKQIYGRARLYKLLGLMKIAKQIITAGRADARTYAVPR